MNFREAINHITSHNDLKVMVSTNYSGSGNPNNASWTHYPVLTDLRVTIGIID
jgi:hypothetical protein